jgi:hypothetical protein
VVEIHEDVAIKLSGAIDYFLSGHPKAAYYVLPEKSFEDSLRHSTEGRAIILKAFIHSELMIGAEGHNKT